MSKGALGALAAYWPDNTARYAHVPLERVTQSCVHKPAAASPDALALLAPDRTVRFSELSQMVCAGAATLTARTDADARIAVLASDPVEQLVSTLACLDADRLCWLGIRDPASLEQLSPSLVIGDEPMGAHATIRAHDLFVGEQAPQGGRADLKRPVLALAHPDVGEVVHNHKTLVATGIAFGSFFMLEPAADVLLLEPPDDWLGIAAVLGTWNRGGTVRVGWQADTPLHTERIDYAVVSFATALDRFLRGSDPVPRAGVGLIAGTSGPFSANRRRRLARLLGTPVLTVLGRNDWGPVLASHPTWFLDGSPGIPLPNVDLRPLHPVTGGELAIGWDAVEEAEIGVKSSLAPAGGELSGSWLRTRLVARIDPTGLYFLRRDPLAARTVASATSPDAEVP
jgi:hypothetical protein